jgi:hypothetical protein
MWRMNASRPAHQFVWAAGLGALIAVGSAADANAQGRRDGVRTAPSPIQTVSGNDLRNVPSARSPIEFLGALEVGVQTGNPIGNLSGTFGAPVSGSASQTNGMVGLDLRAVADIEVLRGPQGTLFGSPARGVTGPGLAFGLRVRTYTDKEGRIQFDVHPTPGDDTFLSYRPEWSVMPYVGMPVTFWNGPNDTVQRVVITPFVGATIERGELKLTTDESGGGGILNTFQSNKTRTGLTLGLDTDLHFQNNWFIGLGGEVNFAPSVSGRGTSTGGFDYDFSVGSSTNFTAKVRLGYNLNALSGNTSRVPR